MKIFALVTLIGLTFGLSSFIFEDAEEGEGINFSSMSLDEAKALAKKEGKSIFIDVYTSWCGPCKMMTRKTFTDVKVGEVFNDKYINLKLDAEKSEDGKFVARSYRVSGYPTLIFIDHKGKLIRSIVGYRDPAGLLSVAESIE
jgi:thiol:disulfide interchange protein